MWDWLFSTGRDAPVWVQLTIELSKIGLTFITILLVTRWTLSRADRKDATARKSKALADFSERRLQSLYSVQRELTAIRLCLMECVAALEQASTAKVLSTALEKNYKKINTHVDAVLVHFDTYGEVPAHVPCDWRDTGEAFLTWTHKFYRLIYRGPENMVELHREAYALAGGLQEQVRWIILYEIGMVLEGAESPSAVWNPEFMSVMEEGYLPFLSEEGFSEFNPSLEDPMAYAPHSTQAKRRKQRSRRISDRSG